MDFFYDQFRGQLEPLLKRQGFELYKLDLVPLKKRFLIRIFLDSESGVTLQDCETVSRQVNDWIFTENLIEGPYILEVSSPGLDRPLCNEREFRHNLNRILKIMYDDGTKSHHIEGELISVDAEQIVIDAGKKKILTLPYAQIRKATVIPQVKRRQS